jgi:hypothetical protein
VPCPQSPCNRTRRIDATTRRLPSRILTSFSKQLKLGDGKLKEGNAPKSFSVPGSLRRNLYD